MKLTERDIEILETVQEITFTDYDIKKIEKEGYIDPYNLISALEDLLCEYDKIEEKIENVKQALHHEGLDYLGW